jgi:hypothetical protein
MEKLIFKYLNDSLTEEELNTLQEWLIKDKENIKVFENIVGEWNLSQQYIDKTKKKILTQILSQDKAIVKEPNFQERIGISTLKKISIAAAAVIALFILNLYDFDSNGNKSSVADSFQTIESGK